MIQQLILSTIFACSTKNNDVPTSSEKPPSTPSQNQPEEETTKEGTTKPDLIGPSIVPPTTEPSIPTASMQEFHGSILVAHILNIQKSNQEISCTLLCQQSLNDSETIQELNIISSCTEKREDNWEELLAQGDESTALGTVDCTLRSAPRIIKGRAPINMTDHFVPTSDLASHFARQAQEEALSVFSFAELHQALEKHNAPFHLKERCLQALIDEQNHTQMALSLCMKHGGTAPSISVPTPCSPDLFTLTHHNAVVGCIQESWAALLEQCQANNNTLHPHLQKRIASDEMRHAQLAWEIHSFLMKQLSHEKQEIIIHSMQKLLQQQKIDWVPSFPQSTDIGIPTLAIQKELYNRFSEKLQHELARAA